MMRRSLALFLCLVTVLSAVPVSVLAREGCDHHTEHDAACGYVQSVEGVPCGHVCGEGCPTKEVTVCIHDHAASGCTYTEPKEAVYCGHACGDGSCAYQAAVPGAECTCGVQPHAEGCGYVQAQAEVPCDFAHDGCGCAEAVTGGWSCGHVCTRDSGCVKDVCAHVCPEDDCGYVKAQEGKECGFVCQACADREAADAVAALVEALPTLEEIKAKELDEQYQDYLLVQEAYEAYQKLTPAQQALLESAETLFKPYFDYFNTLTETAAEVAISTKEQLNAIRNDLTGNYYLTCDIVFTEADFAVGGAFYNGGKLWEPIGSETEAFTGTLDGKGYAIRGLKIDLSGNTEEKIFAGLFANCSGKVSNLTLEGGSVVADARDYSYVGAFAGQAIDGVFTNCVNKNSVTVTGSAYSDYVAGLVGRVDTKTGNPGFYNCSNYGNIEYRCPGGYGAYVGGIAASFYNKNSVMENCTNYGSLAVTMGYDSRIGGLAGASNATIRNCTNKGSITVGGHHMAYMGGIVGVNSGFVTDCTNTASLTASTGSVELGGIAGNNYYFRDYSQYATVSGCVNTGSVKLQSTISGDSGSRFRVGGIVGQNACRVVKCYNTGYVGSITDADASAYANYTFHYTGGVVGRNVYTGGVAGSVASCFNAGTVYASTSADIVTDFDTGGVMGGNIGGSVKDTYNAGNVSVTVSPKFVPYVHTGGIVGSSENEDDFAASVDTSYNVGNLTVTVGYSTSGTHTGGSVGYSTGTVTGCYQLNNVPTGIGYGSGNAVFGIESQLQQQSTFREFDFSTVWTMEGNPAYLYPELIGMSMVGINKTVTGITLNPKPSKTQYYVGDSLDVTGGKIKVSYSDGSSATVNITASMVSGFSSASAGTRTLTVSYGGKTATYTVSVAALTVTSISVSTLPTSTRFFVGKPLNVSGGKLTVYYNNGTSKTVDLSQATLTGYSSTTPGTKTVTATYGGKTATFQVTVVQPGVTSISVNAKPTKTVYSKGEALDLAGGKIWVVYEDNSSKSVNMSEATVTGFDPNTAGTQTVTVTYGGKSATFTVTVNAVYVAKVTVNGVTTSYESLEDAFAAANNAGSAQVVLLKDITGAPTGNADIQVTGNVTLDLGGFDITDKLIWVKSGGSLTVRDSSSQPGTVSQTGSYSSYLTNAGKLTLESGSITCGVDNSGTLTVTGGSVSGPGSAAIQNNGTLTVKGGSVTGLANGIVNMGTLEISGGSVTGSTAITSPASGVIAISGGTVTGTDGAAIDSDGKLTVTGGSITGKTFDIDYGGSATGILQGGTFADGLTLRDITLLEALGQGKGYFADGGYVKITNTAATTLSGKVEVKAANESNYRIFIDREGYAQGFAALDDAFAAVQPGDTLRLTQDAVGEAELTQSGSFTLDLGGKAVAGDVTVGSGAELTVTGNGHLDATVLVKGSLKVPAGTDYSRVFGEAGAKLTVGDLELSWDAAANRWVCGSHKWVFGADNAQCSACGAKAAMNITAEEAIFSGQPMKPQVTVMLGSTQLTEGTDFTLSYENNINAGTGSVTVTGMGSCSGTAETTFTIQPLSVQVAIASIPDQPYSGGAVTPGVELVLNEGYNGPVPQQGSDYTLTYTGNTATGTASVTVSACDGGNFTFQSVTQTFVIRYGLELPGVTGTVYVDGEPKQVEDGFLWLEEGGAKLITLHDYANAGAEDLHTVYPTAMYVYEVTGSEAQGYTVRRVTELDNILQYSGTSIRITGNQGIRFITSIPNAKKAALTGAGLAGYKLVEYGTLMGWYEPGRELLYGVNAKSIAYDRTSGTDQVFNRTGDLCQFTGMLTDLELEQSTRDLMTRPYMVLERTDAAGQTEQVVLYGGSITRSIGYVAYQNKDVFQPGSSSYEFIWKILSYAYPDLYEAEYKG